VDGVEILQELGLQGAAYAAPVAGGHGVGFGVDELVAPASVMKVQVALTVESLIAAGSLDGSARRLMRSDDRTYGPVGIPLMRDDVSMSVRDLVVAMLTVSDNVATDELIAVAGLDEINRTTLKIGMVRTRIASDIRTMLDEIARDLGFSDFRTLATHDPDMSGAPSEDEIRRGIAASSPMDPARGTRTTAAETVLLLQSIWTDSGAPPNACAAVRQRMAQQLTRHRIASAFGPPITVAAKSGALLGVVRNEAGVVTFPDGAAYAVAVFTRREVSISVDPGRIDAGIGRIARLLVEQLRS